MTVVAVIMVDCMLFPIVLDVRLLAARCSMVLTLKVYLVQAWSISQTNTEVPF